MYTEVKSYQFILSLLKQYGIKHCVLSAGSRNLPFVHSVEEDSYYKCYSVVDERSAGYFALGLAQELNQPVVISCTSSTATCNYWPPVAEAYYQNVPLIVLTSDRDQRMVGHWEDQLIDQVGMFDRHVRKSVNLPVINDKDDEIYCQRLINEAFLELNRNGAKGPVHINVPTTTYNRSFIVNKLPKAKKIDRFFYNDVEKLEQKKNELKKYNKILVLCGQNSNVSTKLQEQISIFFEKYNSVIIGDLMSNIQFDKIINTTICMDDNYVSMKVLNELMPDLVISFGGQVFSGIKNQLRKNYGKFDHWVIQEDGKIVDMLKSVNAIFKMKAEDFFTFFNDNDVNNDLVYYSKFKDYYDSVPSPHFKYSGAYAIEKMIKQIPENSILHLSINDSIRVTNFFRINKNIKVYANIGTHGIDGCMSSFIGQSVASDKESFLVIGDLAFFYDMNSLRINSMKSNAHILLINNHGGSEFYYNKIQQNNDANTTARHSNVAEGWVKNNDFIYISAHDKKSFDDNLPEFMSYHDKPILFEVFTEMKTDAEEIHDYYAKSRPYDLKATLSRNTKDFVKEKIGQEKVKKILEIIKN